MSESNTPFNNFNQPDSTDEAPSIWRDPFTGMDEEDSEVDFLVGSLAEIEMTEMTELSEGDRPTADTRFSAESSNVTNAAAAIATDTHPPEVSDLVSLIQELNQCNSALLDRVSQLEEALETSHGALPNLESNEPPKNLSQAQEQITSLYNQLEFAHQTNQRQQILLETLTEQLESSQERVAQLERETSLLQQRYTDQSQALAQTESHCRDLQTRLQRQQRYTLQFKAALEKCLEVPMPQYEAQELPSAQIAGDFLFLPKAQRIKPWAAQSNVMPGKMPWMNLTPGALDAFQAEHSELQATESLNLPTFTLPELQAPPVTAQPEVTQPETQPEAAQLETVPETVTFEEPIATPTPQPAPQSAPVESTAVPSLEDPELMAHISSVVQPLADLIAEAMMAEPFSVDALEPSKPSADRPLKVSEPVQAAAPEVASPEPALPVPMADAEDALWQDLARLIDVSTEDVVKASLSGDFAAFEAIDFSALESAAVDADPWEAPIASAPPAPAIAAQPVAQPPVQASPVQVSVEAPVDAIVEPQSQKPAQPVAPKTTRRTAIQPPLNPEFQTAQPKQPVPQSSVPAFAATSQNSPSPLVYPLRPLKKRQSLAMVELPDFKRLSSSVPS